MYLEHFKLTELPFRLSPDPAFLYLSKDHARAKSYMESTIWFTDGFVIITGEIGSGKTTLIETFLHELEKDVVVAQISQTQVTVVEFLKAVLVQFGFKPFKMRKAELLAKLNEFLVEQYAAGRKVLLIVDEAQNLSNTVLEEVRMLSGIETTTEKVLRIILAGQPELNAKLDSPELVQLAQRVRLRFHLTALSEQDTTAYILHRLEVAGAQGRKLFNEGTLPIIYKYTGGVPRLVNTLCDTALIGAYALERKRVGLSELNAAIEELQWVPYADRSNRHAVLRAPAAASFSPDLTLARIVVAFEGKRVEEHALSIGRIVIGRSSENDLHINSKFVSRHHCQIVTSAESCVVEDLNSTNGVYVKSKRVRKHHLNDGDVIVLGKHEIMYMDERPVRIAEAHAAEASGRHEEVRDPDEEPEAEA